jgi:site-specific recombinase XerD
MSALTLGSAVRGFFEDYLQCQKGLRISTVRSYRDCLRLFLLYVADDVPRPLTRLKLADLTAERVRRFLNNLEKERHNHIRSRNQRLSALRVFFEYLARQNPELLSEAEYVAAIPTKRVPPPETFYMEREEIQRLFTCLSRTGRFALRDRTLLLFLYNTGARVQETADVRAENLELEPPLRVHLHGKGDKWRVCPLWEETAALLRQLIGMRWRSLAPDQPVFVSNRGQALTRYGIYKIVRRHVHQLESGNRAQRRHISPHCFRHTAAVHLLESGVDVNVIRSWLGHVSLETTNRYAEINIRTKEAALRCCEPEFGPNETYRGARVWRDNQSVLDWLESL